MSIVWFEVMNISYVLFNKVFVNLEFQYCYIQVKLCFYTIYMYVKKGGRYRVVLERINFENNPICSSMTISVVLIK